MTAFSETANIKYHDDAAHDEVIHSILSLVQNSLDLEQVRQVLEYAIQLTNEVSGDIPESDLPIRTLQTRKVKGKITQKIASSGFGYESEE